MKNLNQSGCTRVLKPGLSPRLCRGWASPGQSLQVGQVLLSLPFLFFSFIFFFVSLSFAEDGGEGDIEGGRGEIEGGEMGFFFFK